MIAERRRPEGTVTIVFTDIEGSTAIVEELGDEGARAVFGEHDAVLRRVVDEHRGVEVDHEGDAFMFAFSSARRAVLSALAVQRALEEQPVRVRIGLNTGDVIAERDGYFGRAVFVASRVAGRARGGEVLVSELTRDLVGDSREVRFVDRGEFELKGLSGRHRLYEAAAPE